MRSEGREHLFEIWEYVIWATFVSFGLNDLQESLHREFDVEIKLFLFGDTIIDLFKVVSSSTPTGRPSTTMVTHDDHP